MPGFPAYFSLNKDISRTFEPLCRRKQAEYINPLPKNTAEVLKKYKKVVVAEQNLGQFAGYLRMKVDNFTPYQFNEVKGQPFVVSELVAAFTEILNK